jgi:hypothetical protein
VGIHAVPVAHWITRYVMSLPPGSNVRSTVAV